MCHLFHLERGDDMGICIEMLNTVYSSAQADASTHVASSLAPEILRVCSVFVACPDFLRPKREMMPCSKFIKDLSINTCPRIDVNNKTGRISEKIRQFFRFAQTITPRWHTKIDCWFTKTQPAQADWERLSGNLFPFACAGIVNDCSEMQSRGLKILVRKVQASCGRELMCKPLRPQDARFVQTGTFNPWNQRGKLFHSKRC